MAVVHGSATTIRACHIFPRWGSGTPGSRTAASRWVGSGGWPTRRYEKAPDNLIVNIGNAQSLAVRSRRHSPLVFNDPARFRRDGMDDEKQALAQLSRRANDDESGARVPGVKDGCQCDGELGVRAPRVSRLIRRRWTTASATRSAAISRKSPPSSPPGCRRALSYVSYQGNSFDTHVFQADVHSRLLDVHRRRGARVHGRSRTPRARRRRRGADVHGVRTPGRGERQPRHQSRDGDADVHRRQRGEGRLLRAGTRASPTSTTAT